MPCEKPVPCVTAHTKDGPSVIETVYTEGVYGGRGICQKQLDCLRQTSPRSSASFGYRPPP